MVIHTFENAADTACYLRDLSIGCVRWCGLLVGVVVVTRGGSAGVYCLASGGPDAQGAGVCRVTVPWVGGVAGFGAGGGPSVAQSAEGATPGPGLSTPGYVRLGGNSTACRNPGVDRPGPGAAGQAPPGRPRDPLRHPACALAAPGAVKSTRQSGSARVGSAGCGWSVRCEYLHRRGCRVFGRRAQSIVERPRITM